MRKGRKHKQNIKPNICLNPSITKTVFESFLHQAHTIYSEKNISRKKHSF